ncbi:MAG: DUF4407 domain-containing protein [Bacteroidia bacterium]|nr:DUF4407 domain-containing protein [Bacteroidia bacterium]
MDEYGHTYTDGYTDPYQNHYEPLSPVKRFFFACAGAYTRILEACPSEHTKYVGIGATIFLTACLAILSGSFAIFTLVQNVPISIMFGLLWGALIFNLDRYIVSSIRKDGRAWAEIGLAMPRLILAVLISVVITKPIEVELFRNQINSELLSYTNQIQKEKVAQLDNRLGLDSIRLELKRLDSIRFEFKKLKEGKPNSFDFGEISGEYTRAKSTYDSLSKNYNPRIKANENRRNYLWSKYAVRKYKENPDGSRTPAGWDFPRKYQDQTIKLYQINQRLKKELEEQLALVNELEQKRRNAREEYASGMAEEISLLNSKYDELLAMKKEREVVRREELPTVEKKAKGYGRGFAADIQVLEKMKEDDSSIWWMSNLIMLLFIMLETSPVFVKLISKRGPYDYLLTRIEHAKKVESLRYISDINYDLNTSMRLQSRRVSNTGVDANGYYEDAEEQIYTD